MESSDRERMKKRAALEALNLIRDGIVLGLGSGSTVNILLELLKEKIKKEELEIYFVPTSTDVELRLLEYRLKIVSLNEYPEPTLAIDGADAITRDLNLIKGGGGALTREKIVDYSAKEYYVIVDKTKIYENLFKHYIPVEVLPFAWVSVLKNIKKKYDASGKLRICNKGKLGPVVTDNGNFIIDIMLNSYIDPLKIEEEINNIPGVVENGVFALKKPRKIFIGTLEKTFTFE